jgi:iron complex transport system ATP-binding protein
MKREETIRLSGLAIGYPGKHSVKIVAEGITESIHSGELTCLIGENGAGKSTLLRTLSGFLPALSGEITIMGKPLRDYREKELATVIGVVLTEKTNLQNMTVAELVGMGRSPYTGFWGRLSADDRQKVDAALAMVGIAALRDRLVQTLSDGERQKVMIAKALAQETPIIFLDEPTAFLDYPSKVEILHLLHRLSCEMGKTIFLSTHDLELALQVADTVWLMDRRDGLLTGTPKELAQQGSLSQFIERGGGVTFNAETLTVCVKSL